MGNFFDDVGDAFSSAYKSLEKGSKSILGGLTDFATGGAHSANKANIEMNKENRDWMTEMSNTEVQRRVKDLEAAGLNPMLGYTSSASSPSNSPARVEPEDVGKGIQAVSAAQGVKLLKAQTALAKEQASNVNASSVSTLEQAAKTRVETDILRETVPYSAENAKNSANILAQQYAKLANEVESVIKDVDIKRLTEAQMKELQPLVVEFNRLQNAAKRAELPEKEATAKFFENVPYSKWITIMRQLMGK